MDRKYILSQKGTKIYQNIAKGFKNLCLNMNEQLSILDLADSSQKGLDLKQITEELGRLNERIFSPAHLE